MSLSEMMLYLCVSTRLFPGIFVECIVVPQRSLFDKVLFRTLYVIDKREVLKKILSRAMSSQVQTQLFML